MTSKYFPASALSKLAAAGLRYDASRKAFYDGDRLVFTNVAVAKIAAVWPLVCELAGVDDGPQERWRDSRDAVAETINYLNDAANDAGIPFPRRIKHDTDADTLALLFGPSETMFGIAKIGHAAIKRKKVKS